MTQRSELVRGNIDSLLLCLLSQKQMYGYQVLKELEGKSNGYFKYKEGTLYPALHRLETDKLITSEWKILPNSRQRKYYSITEKGYKVLIEKRSQLLDFFKAMSRIFQPAKV